MKKTFILAIAAILTTVSGAIAQQEAQFTQFMFNQLYYNPAYAGLDNGTRFQLIGRTHWLGYNTTSDGYGGINTLNLSVNSPVQALDAGIGFHATLDNIGPQRLEDYQLSLAKHFALGKGKLSLALRPGVSGITLDGSKLRARDQGDPLLGQLSGTAQSYRFDLGAGAMYKEDKFYVGLGVSRLLAPDYNFGVSIPSTTFNNKSIRAIYLQGGYDLGLSDDLTLTPNLLVRYFTDTPGEASLMADINLMLDYQKAFFGGLSYRHGSKDLSLVLGVNLLKDKNLRIVYAGDLVTPSSTVEATARSSHEIGISYALPFVPRLPKPGVKTPRFRF